MIRQLAVLLASLVDAAAALYLTGSLACCLVVCLAGGWACAEYDEGRRHG